MAYYFRKRSNIGWPVTLSVGVMGLNVVMMICWIVLLARLSGWTALAVGVVAFTLILIGASLWLVLSIKEIRLNHRQANFVDSVTHELKSPIAVLQLYLETLRLRDQDLDEAQRAEFHIVMEQELHRLDRLISQLLEVGRLDAIGEQEDPTDVVMAPLLQRCAESACLHHKKQYADVFTVNVPPLTLHARKIVLELIFSNLIDNAVKYGGDPPRVDVSARTLSGNRIRVSVRNNGQGIPYEDRRKVFRIFHRGGSELERRQKGTGLGLYIVQTLVKRLRGKVTVRDCSDDESGCVFEVDLPGLVPTPEITGPQPQTPQILTGPAAVGAAGNTPAAGTAG